MITQIKLRFHKHKPRLKITYLISFLITILSGYFYHTLPSEILTSTISGVLIFSLYEIFSLIMVFMLADIIKKDAEAP